jgi:hypothetical protein
VYHLTAFASIGCGVGAIFTARDGVWWAFALLVAGAVVFFFAAPEED